MSFNFQAAANTSNSSSSNEKKPFTFGSGAAPASGSLFGGSSSNATSSPFGGSSQPSAAPAFSFGGDKASDNKSATPSFTFGSQTPQASPPKNILGSQSSSSSLFGGSAKADDKKPTFGGFNKPSEPSKLSLTTSASELTPKDSGNSASLFGGSSTATTGGFSFGSKPAATEGFGGAFGSSNKDTKKDESKPAFGTSSFGGLKSDDKKPEAGSFGGFGAAKPTDEKIDAKPSSGGLFGSKSATTSAPTGGLFGSKTTESSGNSQSGGLFGSKPTETKPVNGGLSFGGTLSEKKDDSKPAAGGFSFGSTSTEKKDDTKPANGGFSFGSASAEKKEDSKPAAGGFSFGSTTTTADKKEETKPALGGVSFGAKTEEKKDESKPALGGLNFGAKTDNKTAAVTSTPAEEITPSAYLKNRSFEDIIAKWSGALTRSTEGFKAQAADIRAWDRELVQNGEKIANLYNDVVSAEQNQNRIDQLLDYIEKQQTDLEGMLNAYEKQADALVTNFAGKEGLQPTDQERERTYKLAEDLDERLESVGQNLSGIIEEINKVGHELHHSRDDDPITQIVKILNAQLSSLQWIDSSTEKLQANLNHIQELGAKTKEGLQRR